MFNLKENIIDRAIQNNAKIVLPEISDQRIIDASIKLNKMGIRILKISEFNDRIDNYINYISRLKFTNNWTTDMLGNYLKNPINFGAVMVAMKDADGMVAGAINTTAEVIRTSIRVIGLSNLSKWITSVFIMHHSNNNSLYTFTDCSVIPEPTPEQFVVIAKNASDFHYLLTGELPKIAFLSYSTKGSSDHYRVRRVQDAVKQFSKKYPDIIHEGEIQFDAAINSDVAKRKIKISELNGNANVFVFPNLDAANIAYKITERLGGYSAWGPLLQGLNRPINDLSRGCSVNDIINTVCITALQKKVDHANI